MWTIVFYFLIVSPYIPPPIYSWCSVNPFCKVLEPSAKFLYSFRHRPHCIFNEGADPTISDELNEVKFERRLELGQELSLFSDNRSSAYNNIIIIEQHLRRNVYDVEIRPNTINIEYYERKKRAWDGNIIKFWYQEQD